MLVKSALTSLGSLVSWATTFSSSFHFSLAGDYSSWTQNLLHTKYVLCYDLQPFPHAYYITVCLDLKLQNQKKAWKVDLFLFYL